MILMLAGAMLLHGLYWMLYTQVLTAGSIQSRKAALFRTERNKAARIWIMGDSHPMMGLNPANLPGSFNHAATSEYYFLTLHKLKNLLRENEPPEMIILPLDLHSFSAQGNALLLQHELDDVYWSGILNHREIRAEGLDDDWWRWYISARFFPYAGQYYRLLSIFKRESYTILPDGFVPTDEVISSEDFPERMRAAKSRFDAHFQKFPVIDSAQLSALKEIRRICRKANIRLLLLSFPLSHEYLTLSDAAFELWPVQNLQKDIKKASRYLDFSRIFSHRPELFSDPDHLNSQGAWLFSEMLKLHIDSIMKKPAAEWQGISVLPFHPSENGHNAPVHPAPAAELRRAP